MRESVRSGHHGCTVLFGLCAALVGGQALAEISITDHNAMIRQQRFQARHHGVSIMSTGAHQLIDAAGLKYFLNDNITFSTSSSASGAVSEASYTQSVAETTVSGGTTMVRMYDAFDGYGTLCVSFTGATGPCETANASYVIYNRNGAATAEASCNSRQYAFNPQTMGQLQVSRKFFVPSNDTFARWLNYFTNTGGSPVTFNVITSNNLGSDFDTTIVASSNGAINTSTTWVSTFDNYTGNDPRLGHVLQGPGAVTPVSTIHFTNGDDNPYWTYTVTLQPGETKVIMTFVTGQPGKAAANAKAAQLVSLPPNAVQCMTATDLGKVTNFAAAGAGTSIPALTRAGIAALALLLTAAGVVALRARAA